jgi:hypothetical protein
MNPFPADKLVPQVAVIRSSFVDCELLGPPDGLSHEIEIRLKSFQLPLIEESEDVETVETSIRLDYITLIEGRFPGFKALQGREFTFPINPEPGYIEGSVYMYGMHNDVDVTRIIFGKVSGNHISATIVADFDLRAPEYGYDRLTQYPLEVQLEIEGVLVNREIITRNMLKAFQVPKYLKQIFQRVPLEIPRITKEGLVFRRVLF